MKVAPGVVTQGVLGAAGVQAPSLPLKSLWQAQSVRPTLTEVRARLPAPRVTSSPNSEVWVAWNPRLGYEPGSVVGIELYTRSLGEDAMAGAAATAANPVSASAPAAMPANTRRTDDDVRFTATPDYFVGRRGTSRSGALSRGPRRHIERGTTRQMEITSVLLRVVLLLLLRGTQSNLSLMCTARSTCRHCSGSMRRRGEIFFRFTRQEPASRCDTQPFYPLSGGGTVRVRDERRRVRATAARYKRGTGVQGGAGGCRGVQGAAGASALRVRRDDNLDALKLFEVGITGRRHRPP